MPETPSVYWPDHSVEFGFTFGLGFATREVRFSNRRRQASVIDGRPQRTLEGRVPAITWDSSEEIRAFISARTGNLDSFYIFAWMPQQFTGYVVTSSFDGPTTFPPDITLPFKSTSVSEIYDDGTPVTSFTLDVGGGPGGEDEIATITAPPADGSVITADFIGRERIPVVLSGPMLHVDHPIRRHQGASGPADFYVISVIEVF